MLNHFVAIKRRIRRKKCLIVMQFTIRRLCPSPPLSLLSMTHCCFSKKSLTRPHSIKALLISQIRLNGNETDNPAMFHKRLCETMTSINSNSISREVTLRLVLLEISLVSLPVLLRMSRFLNCLCAQSLLSGMNGSETRTCRMLITSIRIQNASL